MGYRLTVYRKRNVATIPNHVIFEPPDFIARLAAFVLKPFASERRGRQGGRGRQELKRERT